MFVYVSNISNSLPLTGWVNSTTFPFVVAVVAVVVVVVGTVTLASVAGNVELGSIKDVAVALTSSEDTVALASI